MLCTFFCTDDDSLVFSQTKERTSHLHALLNSFLKLVNLIMRGYTISFFTLKQLPYKSRLLFLSRASLLVSLLLMLSPMLP